MMTCLTRCGVCRQKREQMLLPVGIRTPLSHPPSRLDAVPVSRYPVLVEVVFLRNTGRFALPAGGRDRTSDHAQPDRRGWCLNSTGCSLVAELVEVYTKLVHLHVQRNVSARAPRAVMTR